jgi:alpha-beta hydrolase superfamily lysophospholipase
MPVEYRLVSLTAADGAVHDAMLAIDERATRRRERMTGRRTACFHVHGIMGNFLVGTLRFLAPQVARDGVPVLVVETRMGNVGQLLGPGIFDRARLDLDAGVEFLADEGFTHIVAMGYSSGATLATRWAATRHMTEMRGLALLGAPWGLPESLEGRALRWGAEPSYEEVYRTARGVVESPDGEDADRLFVIERSRGPTRTPADSEVYTYLTWWHSRGPRAEPAKTHQQIGAVWAPILMIQGTTDEVVDPSEVHRLAHVARGAGNPDVEVVMVDGADHFFKGREIPTMDALLRWMRRHA